MQPSVVSKKTKGAQDGLAFARMQLKAPRFTGGIAAVNPAAVRDAKGFGVFDAEVAVARLETIVPNGITARQSNQIGVKIDVVDGDGGSALTVYAALADIRYNKSGRLVRANGVGYASGATGLFGTAMPQNSPVTVQLYRGGKVWMLGGYRC